jgi:hypothetical protein
MILFQNVRPKSLNTREAYFILEKLIMISRNWNNGTPLGGSIQKWQDIMDGTAEDEGVRNCPLCRLYYNPEFGGFPCAGCIIRETTRKPFCIGTPYEMYTIHSESVKNQIKKSERDFLISLVKVPSHVIKIDRKKISMTDEPTEVMLDNRPHSLVLATNILLCEGPYCDIIPYPYYIWNSCGLFRSTAGTFKWYFSLKDETPDYSSPRIIKIQFKKDIDYEHDPIDEIFVELQDRLQTARKALCDYDPNNDLTDAKNLSDEKFMRYLENKEIKRNL